jgi:hypothetical protein
MKPVGRSMHRWEYNIKKDLRKVGWGMDWIDLAKEKDKCWAFVDAVMTLRVP